MMPPPPPPPPEDRVSVEDGRYSHQTEPRDTLPVYVTFMNIVNTVTNLMLGAIALMAIVFANYMSDLGARGSLTQHIYLCVTGYVIMMAQAILTISPFNGWTQTLKFHQRRTAHWVMQVVGAALAIAGSSIRIMDMESNFGTTHGILGLVALLLTICSLIGGLINLLMSRMQMKRNLIRIIHSCLGVLTVAVAFICLAFGFNHGAYIATHGNINSTLGITLTCLAFVGIALSAFVNMFHKVFSR